MTWRGGMAWHGWARIAPSLVWAWLAGLGRGSGMAWLGSGGLVVAWHDMDGMVSLVLLLAPRLRRVRCRYMLRRLALAVVSFPFDAMCETVTFTFECCVGLWFARALRIVGLLFPNRCGAAVWCEGVMCWCGAAVWCDGVARRCGAAVRCGGVARRCGAAV
jgi:hypothetical protein